MDLLHQWVIPPGVTAPAWLYISVAILALLFTAVSKGGFGGGAGVVSVPLMLQVAPLSFSVGVWLPVLIVCDIFTIREYLFQGFEIVGILGKQGSPACGVTRSAIPRSTASSILTSSRAHTTVRDSLPA